MQKSMRCILTAAGALALSTAAPAQDATLPPLDPPPVYQAPPDAAPEPPPAPPAEKHRFLFGVNAGLYIPSDAKTRDRFGGSGFSIGPGFGSVRKVGDKGAIGLSFSFISQSRGDNKFYLAPIGVQYVRPLGRRTGESTRPFYGVSLNAVPAKIRSIPDGVDSGIKLGYGGSAFIGSTLGRKAFVEGRYRYASEIEGFDLSGLELSAGFRF